MKQRVAILGSTGSIGINTLDVVSRLPGEFKIIALSAGSNVRLLAEQSRRFRPKVACIGTEELICPLKALLPSRTAITSGTDGLKEIVSRGDVDIIVLAIAGTAAIIPLVEAVKLGRARRIALANKEALVSAGPIVTHLASRSGAEIIPVDSEHSAIFQCIGPRREYLSKIYLTGSGGPLLNVSARDFDSLARKTILAHPRWKMGRKISVDSATMMNKGLEIIEAKYLFDISEDRIEVLIHPEAIIHSMVEFIDGSVLAQLAVPDMRIPIQYALTYPSRRRSTFRSVDFSKVGSLTFQEPDIRRFPCLELAREAVRSGGTAPAALCAADEEAVRAYLGGSIRFSEIPKVIEKVLSRHNNAIGRGLSIQNVLDAEGWAKEEARAICSH